MIRLVAVVVVLAVPALAAEGEWPARLKDGYVNNSCAPALVSQGVAQATAEMYCHCIIDAQEVEFGNAEYNAMMAAQPDPDGTDIERRLYATFASCQSILS